MFDINCVKNILNKYDDDAIKKSFLVGMMCGIIDFQIKGWDFYERFLDAEGEGKLLQRNIDRIIVDIFSKMKRINIDIEKYDAISELKKMYDRYCKALEKENRIWFTEKGADKTTFVYYCSFGYCNRHKIMGLSLHVNMHEVYN